MPSVSSETVKTAAPLIATAGLEAGPRHRRAGALASWRRASSVLRMSMAMVMGPTPPGTGVMARRLRAHGREVHVAGQLARVEAVDADVDDDRALASPCRR